MNGPELELEHAEAHMFCATMKVLLRIAAHLIVVVLLAAPLSAQPLSRSVLLLNQSDAGFPFETALATAVRLTVNAESKVPSHSTRNT